MWQAVLCAFVLLLATLYPRSGGSGLVIPVVPSVRGAGMDWLMRHDAAVISPSTDARFLLIRMPSDQFALQALGHGLLIIAVPTALCRPQDR